MPKVSVVVPIYKTEKYIERCVISLFKQSLDDIEYVFVNDGTPDNSIEVLQRTLMRFPHRKKQVKIINKKNGGLASARMYGIHEAKGDYIIHCDSDDWVDTNLYELLYDKALTTGAEVVICPVSEEFGTHSLVRDFGQLGNSCQEVLKSWYKDSVQMYTVNKLVKRKVLKDNDLLPFEGINMWEDNGLMLRVFYYAKGLAQINTACYHYFRGNESAITNGYGRKSVDQMLLCARYLSDFFSAKKDYGEYERTVLAIKFYARINLVTTSFSSLRQYYNIYPESDNIVRYINKHAFSSKGFVRFLFVKYHLTWLFVLLFKVISWFRK